MTPADVIERRARLGIVSKPFNRWGVASPKPDEEPKPAPPNMPSDPAQRILFETCELFQCSKAELIGDSKRRHLFHARQHAAHRLLKELGKNFQQVGKLLNKNQSSIRYYYFDTEKLRRRTEYQKSERARELRLKRDAIEAEIKKERERHREERRSPP